MELIFDSMVSLTGIAGLVLALVGLHLTLKRLYASRPGTQLRQQLIMLSAGLLGTVLLIVALPVSETLRGQLLSLFGILVSAAIALSSTTFVGNAMAGIMLRAMGTFRAGDFIQVGEHLGRVTESDLLHVQIQTEDRDLATLPNLYLVTNPMKVVRADGTIISAEVSLGYDVDRNAVEAALLEAAESAGLEEPYVQVRDLLDHAVVYRVAGLLEEASHLISARARLRARMLDSLHGADIEIVSPIYRNTRTLEPDQRILPETGGTVEEEAEEATPEEVAFDLAEEAASRQALKDRYAEVEEELEALKDSEAEDAQARREKLDAEREALGKRIKAEEESGKGKK